MAEQIIVEAECITSTAADMEYYEQGRTYSIDMKWAKKRDIWRYFRPLREIPNGEVQDRIDDVVSKRGKAAKLNEKKK